MIYNGCNCVLHNIYVSASYHVPKAADMALI
jgi:hypothetical protein